MNEVISYRQTECLVAAVLAAGTLVKMDSASPAAALGQFREILNALEKSGLVVPANIRPRP